jgi:hypothetical protein
MNKKSKASTNSARKSAFSVIFGKVRRLEKWLVWNRPRLYVYTARDPLFAQLDMRASKQIAADRPVILVSQIQRSGGSLMMQLLDGHPALHVYPNELDLLKGMGPTAWFDFLVKQRNSTLPLDNWIDKTVSGYSKMSGNMTHLQTNADYTEDFFFSAGVYDEVFRKAQKSANGNVRNMVSAYFSSFFTAWLNNVNERGDKKYVAAFSPGAMKKGLADIERFFEVYPDGHVIYVVRDPFTWFASARKHSGRYGPLDVAIGSWLEQFQAHAAAALAGRNVHIFTFTELLGNTEKVMREFCRRVAIEYDPQLLHPTFNRVPFWSNSSYDVVKGQIDQRPLARGESQLASDEIEYIKDKVEPVYNEILRELAAKEKA